MALARQGDAQQALSEYGKGRAIIVQLKQQAPDIAALAHDLACFDARTAELQKLSPVRSGASPGQPAVPAAQQPARSRAPGLLSAGPSAHLIGRGLVARVGLGLVGAVRLAIAQGLAAIAAMTALLVTAAAVLSAATVLLAIAFMALALLSAATLALAIRALLAAARVAQITAAAVSSIEIGAAIAIVVGAFRIPTRIAV